MYISAKMASATAERALSLLNNSLGPKKMQHSIEDYSEACYSMALNNAALERIIQKLVTVWP